MQNSQYPLPQQCTCTQPKQPPTRHQLDLPGLCQAEPLCQLLVPAMGSQGKHCPCQALAAATELRMHPELCPFLLTEPWKTAPKSRTWAGTRLEIHQQLTHPKHDCSYKYPTELCKTKQVYIKTRSLHLQKH